MQRVACGVAFDDEDGQLRSQSGSARTVGRRIRADGATAPRAGLASRSAYRGWFELILTRGAISGRGRS